MRKISAFLALGAALAILLAGCGGEKKGGQSSTPPTQGEKAASPQAPAGQKTLTVTIGAGSVTGTGALVAEGIAESIRRTAPGSNVSTTTGGALTNLEKLAAGEFKVAITDATMATLAQSGQAPFQKPITNVRAIAAVWPAETNVGTFAILENTGIRSFKDIADRKFPLKVNVQKRGNTSSIVDELLFKEYGFSYADVEKWGGKIFYSSNEETETLMGDGNANAAFFLTSAPSPTIQNVAATKKLVALAVDENVINKMVSKYGLIRSNLPKRSYDFVKEDLPSVASGLILAAREDFPEADVYTITKALVENQDYLGSVHANLKALTSERKAKEIGGIKLHPGAERYYKEKGLLK